MKNAHTLTRCSALLGAVATLVITDSRAQDDKVDPAQKAPSKKLAAVAVKKVPSFENAAAMATAERNPDLYSLTDIHGREIKAELIEANGEMIRIKREADAQEFEIQLNQLDALSQRRIAGWLERNPAALDYTLDFAVEKRLADSTDFETAGRELVTAHWVYDVKITNLTRNELTGATLDYRIVYDDNVAFSRTSAMPGKGAKRQDGDSVALPAMSFNDRAEFATARLEIHDYKYTPSRGKKESESDRLLGIWIRVTKRGEVISEFRSSGIAMTELAWDNEDESEIIVRDTFREQFEREEEEETARQ